MTEPEYTDAELEILAGRPAPPGTPPEVIRRAERIRAALGDISTVAPLAEDEARSILDRARLRAAEIMASTPRRDRSMPYAVAATVCIALFGGVWLTQLREVPSVTERGGERQQLHVDVADPQAAAQLAATELAALGINASVQDADGLWELRVTVPKGKEAAVAAHLQSATPQEVADGELLVVYRLKLD